MRKLNKKRMVRRKVDFGLVNKPARNLPIFKRTNKVMGMNWKQVKRRFPRLSPNSDIDFDGTINSRDCKPLDPSRDGIFSAAWAAVTGKGMKAVKKEWRKPGVITKTYRRIIPTRKFTPEQERRKRINRLQTIEAAKAIGKDFVKTTEKVRGKLAKTVGEAVAYGQSFKAYPRKTGTAQTGTTKQKKYADRKSVV